MSREIIEVRRGKTVLEDVRLIALTNDGHLLFADGATESVANDVLNRVLATEPGPHAIAIPPFIKSLTEVDPQFSNWELVGV